MQSPEKVDDLYAIIASLYLSETNHSGASFFLRYDSRIQRQRD
jgi:hypothetical protein